MSFLAESDPSVKKAIAWYRHLIVRFISGSYFTQRTSFSLQDYILLREYDQPLNCLTRTSLSLEDCIHFRR